MYGAGLRALPYDQSYDACLEESHEVMYDVAEKVMASAGIHPREVWLLTAPSCAGGAHVCLCTISAFTRVTCGPSCTCCVDGG